MGEQETMRAPEQTTPSLYQRLGGRHGIALVVDDFVAILVADDRVSEEGLADKAGWHMAWFGCRSEAWIHYDLCCSRCSGRYLFDVSNACNCWFTTPGSGSGRGSFTNCASTTVGS